MEIVDFLETMRKECRVTHSMRERLEELGRNTGLHSMRFMDKVDGGERRSFVESHAEELEEQRAQFRREFNVLCDMRIKAHTIFRYLEPEEREILVYRYILGKTWREVAAAARCGRGTALKLDRAAVGKLGKRFPNGIPWEGGSPENGEETARK